MTTQNPDKPAPVVTRFAPSPTGYLHVGGARTALFSWLLARHFGGRFLLRIEDTDLARSTEQATVQLLEDLRWLNLQWDNPELVYQSKRKDVYDALIGDLISRGLAYKAYETREELDAMRRQAEAEKRVFIYRRGPVSAEQAAAYEAEGREAVVRFVMTPREYHFRDLVLDKDIVLPPDEAQDFVIRKGDGMPTYHFAVVVDDAFMGVTHVLRGQEHLKNTFYHLVLQEALGYARPVYGHLPIIMNLDNSKMGKRDRDKKIRLSAQLWVKNKKGTVAQLAEAAQIVLSRLEEWLADNKKQLDIDEQAAVMHVIGLKQSDLPEILVHDFRKNGYLPESLLNFLALLGWSPGGDRERMSMDEMVKLFGIDGIGKSNAKFDRTKLAAFNTEAVAGATPDRLVHAARDYLAVNPDSPLNGADDTTLAKLIHMKKGFRLLRDLDESTRLFFIPDEQVAYDPQAIEKVLKKDNGLEVLRQIRHVLDTVTNWTAAGLEGAVKGYGEQHGLGLGKVAQPVRVAISGTSVSPPIFESLEFLGRERTFKRIDRCLSVAS
jgi:glutamyl/glutaminyl-tRNA synthetase